LFVGLVLNGGGVSDSLVGTLAVIFSIAYYAAPLSTMARVIRKKDASSLYLPLVLVNLLNAVLWFVYGLAGINDIYVWLPNVIGIVLALLQVGLVIRYGSSSPQKDETTTTSKPHPGITRFSSYWVPKEESKPLTRFQSFSRAVSSFFYPSSTGGAVSSQQLQQQNREVDEVEDVEEGDYIGGKAENQIQPRMDGSTGVSYLSTINMDKELTTGLDGDVEMKQDTIEDAAANSVNFGISGTNSGTCS
jgi:uncharacterized protein with PQ loop repeat